ncbi:hypothetical protein ACJD0Z_15370 [Flavobacteriaceae bacterium M23B6Z8]
MSEKSFTITTYKINRKETSIYWHGEQLHTLAHLLCNGSENVPDRFVIFFMENSIELPSDEYLPQYQLGVKFVPMSAFHKYSRLLAEEDEVFVYLDTLIHTNNRLSTIKPVRQFSY